MTWTTLATTTRKTHSYVCSNVDICSTGEVHWPSLCFDILCTTLLLMSCETSSAWREFRYENIPTEQIMLMRLCLDFMQVKTLSENLHENLLSSHLRSILLCHPFIRYQINARTELAVRYNDISPLENHHCAVAFQILSLPECNIFANVDPEAFKKIRQVRYCLSWISCTAVTSMHRSDSDFTRNQQRWSYLFLSRLIS